MFRILKGVVPRLPSSAPSWKHIAMSQAVPRSLRHLVYLLALITCCYIQLSFASWGMSARLRWRRIVAWYILICMGMLMPRHQGLPTLWFQTQSTKSCPLFHSNSYLSTHAKYAQPLCSGPTEVSTADYSGRAEWARLGGSPPSDCSWSLRPETPEQRQ